MTYKASITGLNLGGGKAVIIGNSKNKTPEMMKSFGKFVESLNGKYITAEDVGMTTDDMELFIKKQIMSLENPSNWRKWRPVTIYRIRSIDGYKG